MPQAENLRLCSTTSGRSRGPLEVKTGKVDECTVCGGHPQAALLGAERGLREWKSLRK